MYLAKVISPVSALQSCSLWSKFSCVFGYVSASVRGVSAAVSLSAWTTHNGEFRKRKKLYHLANIGSSFWR